MPQDEKLYSIKDLRHHIVDFIEDEYPKEKKDGERGRATVACTLFTCWLLKKELDKKNDTTKTRTE